MLPASTETNALTVSVDQASSANVAPVTTTDSPSAMMTNSAQRSAMWPPSITQSATEDAPYRGIQNRTAGEMYSMPSATAQSSRRISPSANLPAIQKIADSANQAVMRIAFARASDCAGAVEAHRNTVLPTCIVA